MSHARTTATDPGGHGGQGGQGTELKRVMGPGLLLLFIVGDILGTGVYSLTGVVAAEVGGAVWAPFLGAFVVAFITAFSYLELVTKYPQAAGAALYTHKAFGIHFFTFLVAFTVMSSGITSASTASQAFAANMSTAFSLGFQLNSGGLLLIAVGFMTLVAAVNLRGVGESVKANVVLTSIELSGLLLVIILGLWAITRGEADYISNVTVFETPQDKGLFIALSTGTSLAFFAMVGFEDSVNMAEETKDPGRLFPKIMLTGLGVTGAIYVLVSISAVALVPVGKLAASSSPLTLVAKAGAPDLPFGDLFPFIAMFAVANSALINMLMASRLLYGMGKQAVLPPVLSKVSRRQVPYVAVLFTTALAFGLVAYVNTLSENGIALLGGTTALLLLGVFTVVNVAVLVLRRDRVDHDHFRAPTALPLVGAAACLFLVTPLIDRAEKQYQIGGVMLLIGVVLWAITWFVNRAVRAQRTFVRDPGDLSG